MTDRDRPIAAGRALPRRILWLLLGALAASGALPAPGGRALADEQPVADGQPAATVRVGYLGEAVRRPLPLSLVEPIVIDDGVEGARLGIVDDNTTGQFTHQHFVLDEAIVPEGADVAGAARRLLAAGDRMLILDLAAPRLLAVADLPEAKDALLLNVQATDDRLRGPDCRRNLLHVVPSRAMLADGLAQYLIWKQWNRWFLLVGKGPGDKLYADAIRRAATKFRARIVEDHEYDAAATARRTDTGHAQIQRQMPVLTQGADYDVLIVADESDLFGEYLPYRTWRPRPVAGTQGLVATAWSRTHEQWGATQLQHRFERAAHRWMTPRDYAAWLAARSIAEAATRSGKADAETIGAFVRSAAFDVAGFKGQRLTFRNLGRPDATADPADRTALAGIGVAAGGLSCMSTASSTRSASTSRKPPA
ncbi:MAG: branched-chain amino acid ABC transporter substrate-binding protein [Dongiaceae bacterium]